MWKKVGRPSMFDGKMFFPLQGMPMRCSVRSRTRLADWLPDPFTVPTRRARSLMEGSKAGEDACADADAGRGAIAEGVLLMMEWPRDGAGTTNVAPRPRPDAAFRGDEGRDPRGAGAHDETGRVGNPSCPLQMPLHHN